MYYFLTFLLGFIVAIILLATMGKRQAKKALSNIDEIIENRKKDS